MWKVHKEAHLVFVVVIQMFFSLTHLQSTEGQKRMAAIREIQSTVREINANLLQVNFLEVQNSIHQFGARFDLLESKLNSLIQSTARATSGNQVSPVVGTIDSTIDGRLIALEQRLETMVRTFREHLDEFITIKTNTIQTFVRDINEANDGKLRKMMNVMTGMYEICKNLQKLISQEIQPVDDESKNDDLQKAIREQINVLSVDLNRHLSSSSPKLVALTSQLDLISSQLLEIKDDFSRTCFTSGPVANHNCPAANLTEIVGYIKEDHQSILTKIEDETERIHSRIKLIRCDQTANTISSGPNQQSTNSRSPAVLSTVNKPQGKSLSKGIWPVTSSTPPVNCNKRSKIMFPESCSNLRTQGGVTCDGLHIMMINSGALRLYCDMSDAPGGWTVIMRRGNFSDQKQTSFDHDWIGYRDGFGSLEGEFWLGNEKIHLLTSRNHNQLRIELESFDGDYIALDYDYFKIESEELKYRLIVGNPILQYGGMAAIANSFVYHNETNFSTKDRNNNRSKINCALKHHGAWWFESITCYYVFLTGPYYDQSNLRRDETVELWEGIQWPAWKRNTYLKAVQMKVRVKD